MTVEAVILLLYRNRPNLVYRNYFSFFLPTISTLNLHLLTDELRSRQNQSFIPPTHYSSPQYNSHPGIVFRMY